MLMKVYFISDAIYSTENNVESSDKLLCPSNETSTTVEVSEDVVGFKSWWIQDKSVPLVLVIPFAILLNIRNPKIFTYFNSLGAISVFVMFGFVLSKAFEWGFNIDFVDPSSIEYSPLFKSSFMALCGTLSLAYFIHNCIITIMKSNRHQENNVRDLTFAFMLVAFTYIPIGVIFYSTFPLAKDCIAANFLDNFPPHITFLAIVRAFLLFQMLTVYPLLAYFIRTQLFTYVIGPNFAFKWWRTIVINCVLMALSTLVAIFYPNVGFIIRWVGAISGLAYIFILPCLTYMCALYQRGKLTWYVTLIHSIIILLGFVNFVGQFFLP